jgi:hypothetical protein
VPASSRESWEKRRGEKLYFKEDQSDETWAVRYRQHRYQ